jgi:hypothetical protein
LSSSAYPFRATKRSASAASVARSFGGLSAMVEKEGLGSRARERVRKRKREREGEKRGFGCLRTSLKFSPDHVHQSSSSVPLLSARRPSPPSLCRPTRLPSFARFPAAAAPPSVVSQTAEAVAYRYAGVTAATEATARGRRRAATLARVARRDDAAPASEAGWAATRELPAGALGHTTVRHPPPTAGRAGRAPYLCGSRRSVVQYAKPADDVDGSAGRPALPHARVAAV